MITIAFVLMTALTADAASLRSKADAAMTTGEDPSNPEGSGNSDAAMTSGEDPAHTFRRPGDTRGPGVYGPEGKVVQAKAPLADYTYNPHAGMTPAEGSSGNKGGTVHVELNHHKCLSGWSHNNVTDHCYKAFAEACRPEDAITACAAERVACVNCPFAHLAVPNTAAEATFIYGLGGNGGQMWIGYKFGGYTESARPWYPWADYVGVPPGLPSAAPVLNQPYLIMTNSVGSLSRDAGNGILKFVCESELYSQGDVR